NVYADAEFDATVRWHARISIMYTALHLSGTGNRIHNTRKFHQHAVTRQFDDSPLMLGDLAVDEIGLQGLKCGYRARLVRAHETAVSNYVSGKNSAQATFHLRSEI